MIRRAATVVLALTLYSAPVVAQEALFTVTVPSLPELHRGPDQHHARDRSCGAG